VRGRGVTVPEACWALREAEQLEPERANASARAGAALRASDLASFARVTQWLQECDESACSRIFTVVTESGYQLFLGGYPGPAVVHHLYPPGIDVD